MSRRAWRKRIGWGKRLRFPKQIFSSDGKIRPWVWMAVFACTVLAVGATPLVVSYWSGADPASSSGEFGDQFGLTNAFFSGLALAAVAITLYLQTRELEFQRKENDDTQDILDSQQQQLELQAKLMESQVFQAGFYARLDLIAAARNRENYQKICTACWGWVRGDAEIFASYLLYGEESDHLAKNPQRQREFGPLLSELHRWTQDIGFTIKSGNSKRHEPLKGLTPLAVRVCIMWAYRKQAPSIQDRLGTQINTMTSSLREIYHQFIQPSGRASSPRDAERYIRLLAASLSPVELMILSGALDQNENREVHLMASTLGLYNHFISTDHATKHLSAIAETPTNFPEMPIPPNAPL